MSRSRLLIVSSLMVIAGCGGSRSTGAAEPPELLTLSEARAIEIITEVLAEEGVPRGPSWSVQIAPATTLDVDVRLDQSSFGVEWISPQDRADLGDALPRPAPGGQLRIIPGMGADASAQVLALEHSSYEYANEREAVQRGVPGASEAEGRLRRDVRDFLEYVRGQGGP